MPKFYFDGKEIAFEPGEDVLTAVLKSGEEIPHYCYHPGLSRVATCRMCMVDVVDAGNGRPIPKLQTSCTTSAVENMKVETQNSRVTASRESVMEFLLINHPLDCPICDQAGECSLQDFSYKYGTGQSKVEHEKRVYGLRDIGTFLQLERNRCIHCTRCVRFTEEITGTHEMGMFGRNHQLTVDTFIDYPLSDQFQGNLADICPVGAITAKDFRFKKRVWHLKKTPSICSGCATGCNIWVSHSDGVVYRYNPRENKDINRWWMCDQGRVSYHPFTEVEKRVLSFISEGIQVEEDTAIRDFVKLIESSSTINVLMSPQLLCEEAKSLMEILSKLDAKVEFLTGKSPKEKPESQVFINNLISEDKSPNRNGLLKMNVNETDNAGDGEMIDLLIVAGDFPEDQWIDSYITRAKNMVRISVLKTQSLEKASVIIPLSSPLEKTGIFVNRNGFAQQNNQAVPSAKGTYPLWEISEKIRISLTKSGEIESLNLSSLTDKISKDHGIQVSTESVINQTPTIPSQSYIHG